jgi:hypothetical protein
MAKLGQKLKPILFTKRDKYEPGAQAMGTQDLVQVGDNWFNSGWFAHVEWSLFACDFTISSLALQVRKVHPRACFGGDLRPVLASLSTNS